MSVIFSLEVNYQNGKVGDIRYFRSCSSLAKAVSDGYARSSLPGENYAYHTNARVFSDDSKELEGFNRGEFHRIMDEHSGGFVFAEKNSGASSAERLAWRKRYDKANTDHRRELSRLLEECFTQ